MSCFYSCYSRHPGGLRLTGRAARLAGVSGGMRVADIGCGDGVTLRFLNDAYGVDAVGLDVSEERIREATAAAPGMEFICGSAGRQPFPDNSLDIVILECALSEMDDPGQVLPQVYKNTKPGGRLIISDMYAKKNPAPPWTKQGLIDLITMAGYSILIEEDHTPALVTYAAEHFGGGGAGFGYTLVIAGKM